ncbi:MAG: twin-arginine translocase TatA/TatE family subunit [bacterium]
MFGIGMQELIVILLIALLIFGASRLPEIGRSLGRAINEFKRAGKDASKDIDEENKDKK